MAREERRSGSSFRWFLIGLLLGAALVVGAYLLLNREMAPESRPEATTAEPATPLPDLGGPPPSGSPAGPPPTPAPQPQAAPPPATPPAPPANPATPAPAEPDPQVEDDAAAVGMTGRPVNPDY